MFAWKGLSQCHSASIAAENMQTWVDRFSALACPLKIYTWNNMRIAEQFFMKSDIGECKWNLWIHPVLVKIWAAVVRTLRECLCTLLLTCRALFMVSSLVTYENEKYLEQKFWRKVKHILFQYGSLKSHSFGDNYTKMNDHTRIDMLCTYFVSCYFINI
jgi:hypothetical protein